MEPKNLVGLSEIAELAMVSRQVVSNWRQRYDHFPKPIKTLQSGPVWDSEAVNEWVKNFKGEATHVLSFINLKGGVGKTTTAVAVAEMLAQEERKHVLVVDLDPQTNASVTLIKEERWLELDKNGQTVAQLFADRLNPTEPPKFDIEKAIVRGVSSINDGIARLDLLASSISFIAFQDRIPMIAMSGNFTVNPHDILKKALQPIIDRYDYLIIDCPPSLGAVTKNGLRISTGYVIPTIPDVLSTWGIYQIVENVQRFSNDIEPERPIPALGIVATKVQKNSLHNRVIADLEAGRLGGSNGRFSKPGALPQPPLFKNKINQTVDVARGVDEDVDIRTFKGKYGSAYDSLRGLTKEIKLLCETKKP
jgi:chromosome partitioning protein